MNWDTEIWAPRRLGEAFTLREFKTEHTEYLYAIKADWMGHHGDAMCVKSIAQLTTANPYNVRVGAGPRPWANCWTYEPKIKITPPVWCWDMQEDTMFGLDLKPKRNGNRRKVKLDCVKIHEGRPVYRMIVETADGPQHQLFDSIPVLDPYFAPIWPATAEETTEVAEPAPEPVVDPVAETVIETRETVTNAPEAEQTAPERNEHPENRNVDAVAAAVFAVGGIIHTPGQEMEADSGELIVPEDKLRRVLSTSNTAALVAAYEAQADEDAPASWTGTENRPPGAYIGGQTPFSAKYYYYVWFEEPPTEGEAHE